MLMECSDKGADIFLDEITAPPGVLPEKWLLTFPSYGFVLSIRPGNSLKVKEIFNDNGLLCENVGKVTNNKKIYFIKKKQRELFWDLNQIPYIGINSSESVRVLNG